MRCFLHSLLYLVLSVGSSSAQSLDLGRDAAGKMVAYRQPIPGTDVGIEMVPIPGGTLLTGGAVVDVAPCWVGKYEVTCAQYGEFMKLHDVFQELQNIPVRQEIAAQAIDRVSAPTPVYDPPTRFEHSSRLDSPAASMSQFGARQFTKWLSLLTATDYRLPRSSEWQHACLAGGRSDQPPAWQPARHERNAANQVTLRVGTEQPNAWGMYDMHGNVAEYVIEDAVADVNAPAKTYRTHRAYGGSFRNPPQACQWNSFVTIDREWWDEDAGLPQSPMWLANTDMQVTVGFRIMRPAKPMTAAEKKIAWEADSEQLAADDRVRSDAGRARSGQVDAGLPQAIRENIAGPLRLLAPWERQAK
jgi:formylglycine-generating enzyme required for sulfatase activity